MKSFRKGMFELGGLMSGSNDRFENLTTLNPGDILDSLRSCPLLEPYSLALFCENQGIVGTRHGQLTPLCCSPEQGGLCDPSCRSEHENALHQALSTRKPLVFRCKTGILNFFVPFKIPQATHCCLMGGGVRAEEIDLETVEEIARDSHRSGISLLEELEKLPVCTEEHLEEIARKTAEIIPDLHSENLYAVAFEKTMMRLGAIVGVSPELDRAGSVEQVLSLVGETLMVLFDLEQTAVILHGEDPCRAAVLHGLGSWLTQPVHLNDEQAAVFVQSADTRPYTLEEEETLQTLPGVRCDQALCLPLTAEGTSHGTLVLFNTDLHPREKLLIELLAGRMAARLHILAREHEFTLKNDTSERIIEMISNLSLLDSREALFQRILEMSSDLLHASKGSLMVLDDDEAILRIESSLGMNPELARGMRVRVGSGISGRVAANGHPLLVNDIEKDERIRTANRPRFRTKSFISVPLMAKGEVIAVLNLSDKRDQATFDENDLRLLTTFSPHFSTLIERTESLERANALEELSITDPLTRLYNRRFLEQRMEEEISRCLRQDLALTLILLDLDNFKNYNDLCGHIAGDKALQRTARILRKSAREMDIVTRYGGEEFCILLPGTSKKEAILVAERIRHAVEKENFPREKSLPLGKLTCSLGVASYPADGNTARALINAADIALYRAKSDGRNRTVLFDPTQKNGRISLA